MNAIVPIGATALVPHDMDQAIRLAQAMASAKMVPKHLQDDVGTCLMVVEQAMRWGMSPFAVAQCTSNIGGKLMYEGKLVAAAVQTCGAIVGGFDYKFDGAGDTRSVTVSAVRVGEKEARRIIIRFADVKTTNAMWTKQPDQQLVYSGTRNWARRWTPAALLGVYAPEEFDKATGQVNEPFAGATLEATPEPQQATGQATQPLPPKMSIRAWLDELQAECEAATTQEEANAILGRQRVMEADEKLPEAAAARLRGIRAATLSRLWPRVPAGEEDGEYTDAEAQKVMGSA